MKNLININVLSRKSVMNYARVTNPIRFAICVCFFLFCLVFQTKAEDNLMFEKANQMYHNKLYDSASKLYLQMIQDGYVNAELYYNAGNACYKNNQIGMSVWCFSKAYQTDKSKNVRDNLTLAKNKIKDPFPLQKEIFFIRWWKATYNLLEVNTWAIVSLMCFIISLSILFLKKINSRVKVSSIIATLLFVLSGMSMFFMIIKVYNDKYHYKGILIRDTTFKKSIFDKNSQILTEGVEVEYAGIGKTGINIILPNGEKGMIDGTNFKKL